MMLESISLALIAGKLKGGKFRNISSVYLKGWYLIVICFIIETLSVFLRLNTTGTLSNFLNKYYTYANIVIYVIMMVLICLNIQYKGMVIILIGSFLNFVAILLNGGKMPVSQNALVNASMMHQLGLFKHNLLLTHTLITDKTRLFILSDIIPIPKPYPINKVISIGDIIIDIGIFVIVYSAMMISKRKCKMVTFSYNMKN